MNERIESIRHADGVVELQLARADKMNALDPAMFAAIVAAIAELEAMHGLRAVVLSGEGRAFCAGLDMASMANSVRISCTVNLLSLPGRQVPIALMFPARFWPAMSLRSTAKKRKTRPGGTCSGLLRPEHACEKISSGPCRRRH